jgi:signal transduction histidine kinase
MANIASAQQINEIGTKAIPMNFEKIMQVEKPTNQQLDSVLILLSNYESINVDTALLLAKKVLVLTKSNPKKHFYIDALIIAADAYYSKENSAQGAVLTKEAEELAIISGDENSQGKVYLFSGKVADNVGDYETALSFYLKAVTLYERLKDDFNLAQAYHNISGIFFSLNELEKANTYQNRVKVLAEKLDDNGLRIDNLAMEAVLLMTKGIHFYLKNENELPKETLMDTLNYYFNLSKLTFEKGLEITEKIASKKMEIVLLNNFVALTMNMEDIPKAKILALRAENLATDFGDIDLLIQAKFNLSSVYRKSNQFKKAAIYSEESLMLAKANNLERKVFLAQRNLYELYKKTGQFEQAMLIQEELRKYDKKVGDTERNKALATVEAKYQNVKKEKAIVELQVANKAIARQRNLIIGGILFIGLIGFIMFRFNKIRRERNDKMAFAEALIFAQETERKRIAQDLHDGIGQSLLLMKKELVNTHTVTIENQQLISETLEEVRSISKDLHPFQLEKLGLTLTIESMIDKVRKSTDLFVTTEIDNIDLAFSEQTNIHIFRAVQEALNNVIKHSKATAAKVTIEKLEKETLITILDNGQGFDYELAIAKAKNLGLKTMYERLAAIGGKMKISKNEPSGTRIEFRI